jgi:uncharacterized Zn finger protein
VRVILFFGTRVFETLMNVVVFVCHYCGNRVDQRVMKSTNRFTLFFLIPLFSLGSNYYVQCTNCGGVTELSRQQAEHSLGWSAQNRVA